VESCEVVNYVVSFGLICSLGEGICVDFLSKCYSVFSCKDKHVSQSELLFESPEMYIKCLMEYVTI
jgi:hypothetical protein